VREAREHLRRTRVQFAQTVDHLRGYLSVRLIEKALDRPRQPPLVVAVIRASTKDLD
jgi:hypothetical protein